MSLLMHRSLVVIAIAVVWSTTSLDLTWAQRAGPQGSNTSRLTFAVASVKPWDRQASEPQPTDALITKGGYPYGVNFSPNGRMSARAVTVLQLMARAFNVPQDRIVGGPPWIGTARFDIDAKADESAVTDGDFRATYLRMQPMLEHLLVDRFKLHFHRESRIASVYRLTGPKDKVKVTAATRDCSRPAGPIDCHAFYDEGPRFGFRAQSINTTSLAQFLASKLDRPVVDEVHIQELFDLAVGPWSWPQATAPDRPPTLIDRMYVLGFKLEPGSAPLETIVVDQLTSPSAN